MMGVRISRGRSSHSRVGTLVGRSFVYIAPVGRKNQANLLYAVLAYQRQYLFRVPPMEKTLIQVKKKKGEKTELK